MATITKPKHGMRSTVDWIVPAAAVSMVFVMLVPMPSFLLDLLLALPDDHVRAST